VDLLSQIEGVHQRKAEEVFNEFSPSDEFVFNKTVIPLKLAQYEPNSLVSRSQAKRILNGLESFNNIIFDFNDVPMVGQAFADEIFRVYANKNPNKVISYINLTSHAKFMVKRAINAR
jgi:hypothetical protein